MKKITMLVKVLAMLMMVLLAFPTFLLSASAVEVTSELGNQTIKASLQTKMKENREKTTRTIIWLKDYDSTEALQTRSMPDYQTRLNILAERRKISTAPNETVRSIELKRAALKLCYEPYTADFGSRFLTSHEIVYSSTYMPIVVADLSSKRIEQIAKLGVVDFMDYYGDDVVEEENTLSTTSSNPYTIEENIQYINAGNLRNAMPQGTYVRVGIVETKNPQYRSLFSGKNIVYHYPNASTATHGSAVMEILVSLAPYASFYYAVSSSSATGTSSTTWISEFDWLLDNNVNVVNISQPICVYADDGFNHYNTSAYYLDQLIYTYNITLVKSAGNHGSIGVNSGGMAYNIITVGNFDANNECMNSGSSYGGATSTHTSKPDISAPGSFTFPDGGRSSGTSLSAPMITGVIALMMSVNTKYLTNTPLIKSTLASCTLDDFSYTTGTSDFTVGGAGVIDAAKVRSACYASREFNGTATTTLYSYDTYTINCTAGDTIRIALSYEKRITDTENCKLPTLGIYITNWDDGWDFLAENYNLKVFDFTPASSGEYEIQIMRYADTGTTNSADANAPYSIVWYQ